jgi:hypothetical protein
VAAAAKDRSKESDRSYAADDSTESGRASVAVPHAAASEPIDGFEAKNSESERKPLPLIAEVGAPAAEAPKSIEPPSQREGSGAGDWAKAVFGRPSEGGIGAE